jgi:uncharacterized repeat protein (TIGR01451 family)
VPLSNGSRAARQARLTALAVVCGMAFAPADAGAQASDLILTKTDFPDPVNVGNELHYRLAVFNSGPGIATNVKATDTLPAGVEFVSATPPSPTTAGGCSFSAGVVTCVAPNQAALPAAVFPAPVAPNGSVGWDIFVRPTQQGSITNSATLSQAPNPPLFPTSVETDPSDNTDSESTTVGVAGPPPVPAQQLATATCKGKTATIVDEAGDGNGVVKGTFERDVVAALGGNDRIKGGGGPDLICGGPGRDLIRGGRGDDELKGGKGGDALRGGAGDDECNGGAGRDSRSRC